MLNRCMTVLTLGFFILLCVGYCINLKYYISLLQSDLAWVNWSTIQDRVREAQPEHHMCVHKQEINELDIYHRILRLVIFIS